MSRSAISSTSVAASTRDCSFSSSGGSAAKLRIVWARGSRPLDTCSRTIFGGNAAPICLNAADAVPVDGSEPTYFATSGSTSSSLKAPTMKNVKSAALANRAL